MNGAETTGYSQTKKIFYFDPFIESYTKVSYVDNEKWKC